jgi:biotin carboxyl carrier protein
MFINYEHENNVYNVSVEQRKNKFFVTYDNNEYTIKAVEIKKGQLKIEIGDRTIKCVISEGDENKFVFIEGNVFKVKRIELTGQRKTGKKEIGLNSPISGTVVNVKIKSGDNIKKNDVIMIIEAMKMEYLIRAPYNGKVKKVNFKAGDQIEIGQITADIVEEGT